MTAVLACLRVRLFVGWLADRLVGWLVGFYLQCVFISVLLGTLIILNSCLYFWIIAHLTHTITIQIIIYVKKFLCSDRRGAVQFQDKSLQQKGNIIWPEVPFWRCNTFVGTVSGVVLQRGLCELKPQKILIIPPPRNILVLTHLNGFRFIRFCVCVSQTICLGVDE